MRLMCWRYEFLELCPTIIASCDNFLSLSFMIAFNKKYKREDLEEEDQREDERNVDGS